MTAVTIVPEEVLRLIRENPSGVAMRVTLVRLVVDKDRQPPLLGAELALEYGRWGEGSFAPLALCDPVIVQVGEHMLLLDTVPFRVQFEKATKP